MPSLRYLLNTAQPEAACACLECRPTTALPPRSDHLGRWNKLGLTELIRAAMERGCVLSGGSAGCICWFDAGHSDSHDPESYKNAMLGEPEKDAEGTALQEGDAIKNWT